MDGVIADFNQGWVDFYNREFGADLHPGQVEAWDGITGLTHFEDMDQFWKWTSNLDGRSLFWHLRPYPGAVEALHLLHYDGHEIVIVTTKPGFAEADTHEWLVANDVPAGEVHILEEKWRVDCDVYLDDGPHILSRLVAQRPDRVVCRYVRPWNHLVPGAVDVHDFDEFRDLVGRLERSPRT